MEEKRAVKKLTLDEMPVLKEAIEILNECQHRWNLGACMVSNNILTGKGKLRWCYRHEPHLEADVDNGWEFYSDIDTEEYVNILENWTIISWDQMFIIEPAIDIIFDLPAGSDLVFTVDGHGRRFIDVKTGKVVVPEYFAQILKDDEDLEKENITKDKV